MSERKKLDFGIYAEVNRGRLKVVDEQTKDKIVLDIGATQSLMRLLNEEVTEK